MQKNSLHPRVLDHEHRDMNETRETANADVYQAIARSVKDSASGRAEDIVSCSQKNSQREFFCEQDKTCPMLPQAKLTCTG
jgi:hypothetical protein